MKKLKFIIISVLVLILSSGVVKAEDDCDSLTNGVQKNQNIVLKHNKNNSTSCGRMTKFELNGGANYAFCYNPGISAPNFYSGSEISCQPITSEKEEYKVGISKILENGYNAAGHKSDEWYSATTVAIRAIEYYYGQLSGADSSVNEFTDLAIILADDQVIGKLNTLLGKEKVEQKIGEKNYDDVYFCESVSNSASCSQCTGSECQQICCGYASSCKSSGSKTDVDVKTKAKQLINDGLQAIIDSKNEPVLKIEEKLKNELKVQYKITIQNIEKDVYINQVSCYQCSQGLASYKFKIGNQEFESLQNVDLTKYLNGKDSILLDVIFTKGANYKCEDLNFNIRVYAPNIKLNADLYHIMAGSGKQKLYIQFPNNTDELLNDRITSKVNLCGNNCDDLKPLCEQNPNDPRCKDYEKDCKMACGYFVSNIHCSDEDQTIVINEGIQLKSKDSCEYVDSQKRTNVKGCILDKEDVNGNTYVDKNLSNAYCTISCKEDYIINVPGQLDALPGGKISISAKITGNKTCYTSEINKDQYNKDLAAAGNLGDRLIITREFDKCVNLDNHMSYNFNPSVSFKYNESYSNLYVNNEIPAEGYAAIDKNKDILKCLMNVNDYYDDCTRVARNAQDAKYVKVSMSSVGTYTITPTLMQVYPTGTIINSLNSNIINSVSVNGAPISLDAKRGVYAYQLIVNDLGEYYDSDKLGRIWGAKDSIVTAAAKDNCHPSNEGDDFALSTGNYVCSYAVNCPECKSKCKQNKCSDESKCPNNDCPSDCVDCISKDGKRNFSYRPISSSNPNPNNRTLGRNWNFNESDVKTSIELKALKTTKNIINEGELIFDESSQLKDNVVVTVNLNSKIINKISEYNKAHQNDGGYTNNTLRCYDYGDYKNVYCYSTFIDEIFFYDNEVRGNFVSGERITGSSASDTDNQRNVKANANNYWTPWTEANLSDIQVTDEIKIESQKNYGANKIGPSWR